jgi:hypothetical protein
VGSTIELDSSSSTIPMKSSSRRHLLIIFSVAVLFVALIYQPLPEDFPQPWKYRFISFWCNIFVKIVCLFSASFHFRISLSSNYFRRTFLGIQDKYYVWEEIFHTTFYLYLSIGLLRRNIRFVRSCAHHSQAPSYRYRLVSNT